MSSGGDHTSAIDRAREAISARRRRRREFQFPSVQDPDVAWVDAVGFGVFDLSDDDFLDGLPDPPPRPAPTGGLYAESQSVPLSDDVDEWLAGFNRPLLIGDDPGEPANDRGLPAAAALAQRNGYNFTDPTTERRRRIMMARRAPDPHRNETPITRFQRLYRTEHGLHAPVDRPAPQRQGQNPHVQRSPFGRNDARTRRLQRLHNIWLNPPMEANDG
jgi:hypothetical protein